MKWKKVWILQICIVFKTDFFLFNIYTYGDAWILHFACIFWTIGRNCYSSFPLLHFQQDQKHREYRQKIISNYQVNLKVLCWVELEGSCLHIWSVTFWFSSQPLYRELYTLNPSTFFVQSFSKAFSANDKNRDESIRSIMSEPAPGIYTFDMLQPRFCDMLLNEVLIR